MRGFKAIVSFGGLLVSTSAVQAVNITTFDDWLPDSVYASWPNGNLSPNATNFGVQATGYGGGYANIIPNPDGTGTNTVQLLATVNSGVAGFLVTLGDTAGHEWNYAWFGKTPGNGAGGSNDYVLTQNIADFNFQSGPLGQLDLANLDFIHIQVDPGGQNLTTPYDVTFNDLSVSSAVANLNWNNLGTGGNGTTWERTNFNNSYNWNNGNAPAKFHAGDNVSFTNINNGNSNVTINSVVAPGSTTVNSSLAYVFNGTGGIGGAGGLTVSGTGSLTLNTANTYAGATTVNGGATLNVNGSIPATALNAGGNVNFAANAGAGILARTLGPITLARGGKVTVAASSTTATRTVLITGGLSFGGTLAAPEGTLDLTSNDMIVRGGSATSVRAQLKAGLTGTSGITWAGGAAGSKRPGYAAITTAGTFAGQAVTSGDVVVKYTILGDADLSGDVAFPDLVSLAQNYNGTNTVWATGDFDYDGVTNFADLVGLAQNYNQALSLTEQSQLGGDFAADWALAQSLVPEPGLPSVVGLAGGALARRRRR